jgi:predicted kinase
MTDSGDKSQPDIILITGNMAAGKSSVAQALAERLPRSVHLRGDLFRRLIVNGQAQMDFELSPEAAQQLQLRYELSATVARRYVQAGFTVVYQDILIGEGLGEAVARLRSLVLAVVVLCPHPEVIAMREAARGKTGYANAQAIYAFDQVLRQETPRLGYWLDSSALSLAETVDDILAHLPAAIVN